MSIYTFSQNLLNVLVQIANKNGFKIKKTIKVRHFYITQLTVQNHKVMVKKETYIVLLQILILKQNLNSAVYTITAPQQTLNGVPNPFSQLCVCKTINNYVLVVGTQ
jgi:hypothetical protein